jgi:hypothetical protein
MSKAVRVTTSGEVEVVVLPKEDAYLTIRDAVGGTIDAVSGDNWTMYVHDEGLLLGFPINGIGSVLASRLIVGDVIFVGNKSPDGVYDGADYDAPHMFFMDRFSELAESLAKDETLHSMLELIRQEMGFDLPMTTN